MQIQVARAARLVPVLLPHFEPLDDQIVRMISTFLEFALGQLSQLALTYVSNPGNNRSSGTVVCESRRVIQRPLAMALRRAGASLSQRLLPQQAQCATNLWEQTSQIAAVNEPVPG